MATFAHTLLETLNLSEEATDALSQPEGLLQTRNTLKTLETTEEREKLSTANRCDLQSKLLKISNMEGNIGCGVIKVSTGKYPEAQLFPKPSDECERNSNKQLPEREKKTPKENHKSCEELFLRRNNKMAGGKSKGKKKLSSHPVKKLFSM